MPTNGIEISVKQATFFLKLLMEQSWVDGENYNITKECRIFLEEKLNGAGRLHDGTGRRNERVGGLRSSANGSGGRGKKRVSGQRSKDV
jgi:hypothetical protein